MIAPSNDGLIEEVRTRALSYLGERRRDERVLEAMRRVDRARFLPPSERVGAYSDRPVAIGHGQSCSQPSMVALVLDELAIRPGNDILEVGAGCGYLAAIASLLCRPGRFVGVELIPELAAVARAHLASSPNVVIVEGNASRGLPGQAPFDRIVLSAGVDSHDFDRTPFLEQLRDGGVLVYPQAMGNLFVVSKQAGQVRVHEYRGVSFVPLILDE